MSYTAISGSIEKNRNDNETMKTKRKNAQNTETNGAILSRSELLKLHDRVVERMRRMTPEEGFKTLVASGIYTPDGKLAKEYGG